MNKLLLIIGSALFLVLLVVQWLTYTSNVEFSIWLTLAFIVQGLFVVPVLLYGLGMLAFRIRDYVIALFALISVLAIAGWLGVPRSADPGISDERLQVKQEMLVKEKTEALEVLKKKLEIAEEEEDEAKRTEEYKKADDDVKKFDDKEDMQRLAILEAKEKIASFDVKESRLDVFDAQPLNILLLLSGFLMLVAGVTNVGEAVEARTQRDGSPKPAPGPAPAVAPAATEGSTVSSPAAGITPIKAPGTPPPPAGGNPPEPDENPTIVN